MYIPPKFNIQDPDKISAFIKQNSFGTLLSIDEAEIQDTHTPFILSEDGILWGHIARANPQWKSWQKNQKVNL